LEELPDAPDQPVMVQHLADVRLVDDPYGGVWAAVRESPSGDRSSQLPIRSATALDDMHRPEEGSDDAPDVANIDGLDDLVPPEAVENDLILETLVADAADDHEGVGDFLTFVRTSRAQ